MTAVKAWRTRANERALRTITGCALIFAGLGLVSLVARSVGLLGDRTLEIVGLQLVNAATPTFAEAIPSITAARYESVTLFVDGLPADVRWLLVAQASLQSLLAIGLCVIVFILGMRLLEQRPFAKSATWAIFAAAVLVMITGLCGSFLEGLAHAQVAQFLGEEALGGGQAGDASHEGLVLFGFHLDPAPIWWALALGVIASAFEIGHRLQRDAEGLV